MNTGVLKLDTHSKNLSQANLPKEHLRATRLVCLVSAIFCFVSFVGLAIGDEFVITSGDELRIFIPGMMPPEQLLVVDPNGQIDLGIHGKVKVSGVSIRKAKGLLKQHLETFLKSVEGVTLLLKQSRRTILITGCVARPGLVTIESNVDLWQALHQAGGISACADLSRVMFLRGGLDITVNLRAYLTRDSKEPLPRLRAGDTVFVPAEPGMPLANNGVAAFLGHQAINRKVFVIGAVEQAGMFDRSDALDVLTAVSLAGGPSADADLGHATLLTENESIRIDLQKALTSGKKLKKNLIPGTGGAIIYIPSLEENVDNRVGEHINVIGPFSRTGRIPVSGPIKLIDAIGLVGGPTEAGKIHKLSIIEDGPGFTLASGYNVKKYLKEGGWVGRVPVQPNSTIIIGRRDLTAFNTTLTTISTLGMVSATMAMWLTLSGVDFSDNSQSSGSGNGAE
jgi:polysaccharide export outer membrane protein